MPERMDKIHPGDILLEDCTKPMTVSAQEVASHDEVALSMPQDATIDAKVRLI